MGYPEGYPTIYFIALILMLYGYLMGWDLMKWGVLQMIGGVGSVNVSR